MTHWKFALRVFNPVIKVGLGEPELLLQGRGRHWQSSGETGSDREQLTRGWNGDGSFKRFSLNTLV